MQNITCLNQDGYGDLACLRIGNFASAAASQGLRLTRSKTAINRIYADDFGAALNGTGSVPDIRNSVVRTLLTTDHTGGHVRVHSLMGQLKAYNSKWNTEVASAVHGRLELVRASGTMTLGGYGKTAAMLGVISNSGAVTIDTNHILAGCAVYSDFDSSLTQTGKVAGYLVDLYDISNWSDASRTRVAFGYGVHIANSAATTGVNIGTCTTAIVIGTCTTALDMSSGATGNYVFKLKDSVADALSIVRGTTDMMVFDSSTPKISITPAVDITGDLTVGSSKVVVTASTGTTVIASGGSLTVTKGNAAVGAFSSATAGSGTAISAANTAAFRVYGDDGGAKLAAGEKRVSISRFLYATSDTDATDQTMSAHVGQVKVANDLTIGGNLAGLCGYLEVAAAKTLIGGRRAQMSVASALWARVDLPSTAVAGTDAIVSGLAISANLGGTHTGACSMINVPNPSAGTWDYFLDFGAAPGAIVADTSNVPAAATYKIKCRCDSVDFYLIGVADF